MKKSLLSLLMLCVCLFAYAGNSVSVSVPDGAPGDTVTVQVSISASDHFVAAEFTFPIIGGLSYIEGSFKSHVSVMSSSSVLSDDGFKVIFMGSAQVDDGLLFSIKAKLGREPVTMKIQPSVILSDDAGRALTVTVLGADVTITAPKIAFSTDTVDFGRVAIRSTYTRVLEISNTGTAPLSISSITPDSEEITVSETSFSVPSGKTKPLELRYSPSNPGSHDITLTVNSDAVDNTISVVTIVSDAYSVNELKVGDATGETDSIISVDLLVDNMDGIAALQCYLPLPDGITYIDGSFVASDRMKDMKYFPSVDGGALKLYVYSESGGLIQEGSGKVASFKLYLGCTNGIYKLVPESVILGNREQVNVLSATEGGVIEVVSPMIECDTILDLGVTALPETVAGELLVKNRGKKDLVIDNVVFDDTLFCLNGSYPITISAGSEKSIGIICKSDSPGRFTSVMSLYTNVPYNRIIDINIVSSIFEPNYITSQVNLNQDSKSGSLSVSLSNYNKIAAIQMNVYGLEEKTVDKASLSLTDRCKELQSVMTLNNDGSVRVFIYSLANKFISGNSGEIFSFGFSGNSVLDSSFSVRITDVVISDENGRNVSSMISTIDDDIDNDTVANDTVEVIETPTKVLYPVTPEPNREDIFDMVGRRIYLDPSALPPGIYIRNGRKFVVE